MKIVYFTHSLRSCWNHGNAHFVRGVLRSLSRAGHRVSAYEPSDGWSLRNLLSSEGPSALAAYMEAYPDLISVPYGAEFDEVAAVDGADLVIVHEWNEPELIARIGRARRRGGRFTLLFHDTHHRAVSDPDCIRTLDLSAYDGVLAFGEALADVYRRQGWADRAYVWHEAADVTHFQPPDVDPHRERLIWIGNWGDEERSAELSEYLLQPAAAANLPLHMFGVRYPVHAQAILQAHGATYRGWLANAAAPLAYATSLASVHVPRRFYADVLRGIPTIRVFETLACGVPLASAPWTDEEGLFRGDEFLMARSGKEMARHLRALASDPGLRAELRNKGLEIIRDRHTCDHRARELMAIVRPLRHATPAEAAA